MRAIKRSRGCKTAVAAKEPLCGYQVDDAARAHIRDAGYADYFFHRTGHSIGVEVHGTGANMDNLETHDERRVIPWTCFSIEPGIYLPEFGVRSEVDVFVDETSARVTGEMQEKLDLAVTAARAASRAASVDAIQASMRCCSAPARSRAADVCSRAGPPITFRTCTKYSGSRQRSIS